MQVHGTDLERELRALEAKSSKLSSDLEQLARIVVGSVRVLVIAIEQERPRQESRRVA